MRDSLVQTVTVPQIGANNPALVIQAGDAPMRALVRNVGGNLVYIAHANGDLSQINSLGAVYQLPAGQADVFVLAPRQTLFAASNGGGGQVSVALSEAIPVGQRYMES